MRTSLLFVFTVLHLAASAQNPLVKQWDRRFGGSGTDFLNCFRQTADGGYILGGQSLSQIDGDKTQPTWNNSSDYWIVKTDSLGNKEWDKDFGGFEIDIMHAVIQTDDGGYLFGGYSYSDASGDKTDVNRDCAGCSPDYWIVRTDSAGNKLWDKTFGGGRNDFLYDLVQTSDKGFLLAGYSNSYIDGDKSAALNGYYDYWIVKTDSTGNKLWDNGYGGLFFNYCVSVQQTADQGFIVGGYSNSGIGGTKSEPNRDPSYQSSDYWMVKTDASGNVQWEKTLGGNSEDKFYAIVQTHDHGFVLAGHSASPVSGEKTQPTYGNYDFWIIKTDSTGAVLWDKDIGGTAVEDELRSMVETSDHGFLLCGNSFSPPGADKTELNLGPSQAWMIKTDPAGNVQWDKTIFTRPDVKVEPYVIQTKDSCYAVAFASYSDAVGYHSQPNWDSTNGSADFFIVKLCDTLPGQQPVPLFTPLTSSFCGFGCTSFFNMSGAATSYSWTFNGATPPTSTDAQPQNICYSVPGSYDVTLVAYGNGTDTMTVPGCITVHPFPVHPVIQQSGDTLFVPAVYDTYQWRDGSGITISGATNYYFIPQVSGNYMITVHSEGCSASSTFYFTWVGIETVIHDNSGLVFSPNPVTDILRIAHPQQVKAIEITNFLGEKMDAVVSDSRHVLRFNNLPAGIYFLKVISGEKVYVGKVIRE